MNQNSTKLNYFQNYLYFLYSYPLPPKCSDSSSRVNDKSGPDRNSSPPEIYYIFSRMSKTGVVSRGREREGRKARDRNGEGAPANLIFVREPIHVAKVATIWNSPGSSSNRAFSFGRRDQNEVYRLRSWVENLPRSNLPLPRQIAWPTLSFSLVKFPKANLEDRFVT